MLVDTVAFALKNSLVIIRPTVSRKILDYQQRIIPLFLLANHSSFSFITNSTEITFFYHSHTIAISLIFSMEPITNFSISAQLGY